MAPPGLAASSACKLTAELVAACERPLAREGQEMGISYFSEEDYRGPARQLIRMAEGGVHVVA